MGGMEGERQSLTHICILGEKSHSEIVTQECSRGPRPTRDREDCSPAGRRAGARQSTGGPQAQVGRAECGKQRDKQRDPQVRSKQQRKRVWRRWCHCRQFRVLHVPLHARRHGGSN